ncbi:AAA family ATPase [Coleofasciculus sp. FACHB-64]|uniref:trifunctional serine/threonine-protein kinase/ATP-binding protein/sensor histidine kinase n=1 Tax=Cyanophyceae TaxID=3028117 RepID=UPI00168826B4|nr:MULTISPECIES: AAA family ATPase [unclassified Coleofasciculus]MBD1840370.1 AAA family ATPase [Coleofasciculus sp. FACHB-501]MBD2045087.1 AAA family ATPase [Coleofasciculus sp. FACHB-64]
MVLISGYEITNKIYEGTRTVVYQGKRHQDEKSLVFKLIKNNYPSPKDIARIKNEYEIIKALNTKGVVKTLGLENHKNGFALVLEDSGGESLNKVIADRPINFKTVLKIAVQVSEIIGELHSHNIIHKDIKPHNIIFNQETGEVKIIDFSIASRLSLENQTISSPNLIEGTLAYMSPEQTGRMNRSIDYRTDFYSLGVTLYEMLVGKLPFETTDAMELVHCHIAKQPIPPHVLVPEIPLPVSEIVMKLLTKTAEDRYQSAAGLKFDLENCLIQLETTGEIEYFICGQRDRASLLLIPQKLYGRETEVATLMDAFGRVSLGATEMMLVSGYSGIGKTSVVNEVHKPIVGVRGYFINGKFDQFKRNIPYAALIQAFSELMRQLLTESSEQIDIWKEKLEAALGENGQVIIDVIPEVELIVGEQPVLTQLGPSEAQNRFNRVFQQFIRVFCQKEHPLVLFLDDLQWADSASLKLIELLVTDPDSQHLLTIGAFRDNEVSPTHPLIQAVEKIQVLGAVVNNITLRPLDSDRVSLLVADTLHENVGTERGEKQNLSSLLFNKTQGNPFFLTQLIKTLYTEKLLTYNFSQGRWQWDIEEIQAVGITDYNIVELIARNIQKLPDATQQVLKLAACIGNQFNLDVLAIVNEKSQSATAADLWDALQTGLILPLSDAYKIPLSFDQLQQETLVLDDIKISYKFLHDRVQQAAYSLIPEFEKKSTHLKIGQLLLENTSPEEREENIFALVNQLNFGTELLNCQSQRDELAHFNLIAGRKASTATAYQASVNYLNIGLRLLAADSWICNYELTNKLYVSAAEAEYLNTNFEQSKILAEVALQNARTLLDRVNINEIKIQYYIAQNQLPEAIELGQQVLEMLEVPLEQEPSPHLNVEDCYNLLEMTDPYKMAAMKILITISPPAFISSSAIALPIVYTMVKLCSQYGNSSLAIYGYSTYGLLLCGPMADIDSGYKFGKLAFHLLDKLYAKEIKSKIYSSYCACILHWKEHIKETIELLRQSIQSGLEVGDIEFACHSALFYCEHSFLAGEYLEIVTQKQANYIEMIGKFKKEFQLYYASIGGQVVSNLTDDSSKKSCLSGKYFNEAEMLPHLFETNNLQSVFAVYFYKSMLAYLFKDYDKAIENARAASQYTQPITALIVFVEYNLYYSLALLAQYPNLTATEQQEYMAIVAKNQEKMQQWATHAPANSQHKYELVQAEIYRVSGQTLKAMEYYDRAINGARIQGYIQEEALAYERAAEFYLALGREKIARDHMSEAYYGYVRWGATAKVKELEIEYPYLISQMQSTEPNSSEDTATTSKMTTSGEVSVLDLATVMKASLAISGEIVLDKLLASLMKVSIENAGAIKGFLVLPKNGKLLIEAAASIDSLEVVVQQSIPMETSQDLPVTVINYVARTRSDVVLENAAWEGRFTNDTYIQNQDLKSVLCIPIINSGRLIAILYLENNLTVGAFTPNRMEVLKLLSSQAAISLENALLYTNLATANEQLEDYSRTLEHRVQERTRELKLKEARLAEAQRLAHLGSWQFDIETQEVNWSDELFRIFGLHPEQPEPTFREHQNLIHPDNVDLWLKSVDLAIERGKAYELELRIFRPDSSIRYIFVKGEPTCNASGKVTKLLGTALDITDRKLAELAQQQSEAQLREQAKKLELTLRELQQTQSQLIQTEKMSSLGQMIAGIAHEINNPVNFIYGNIDYANNYIQDLLALIGVYQQEYQNPTPAIQKAMSEIELDFVVEDLQKLFDSMKVGAERIRDIVLSLRNFSRLDQAEMKPVDIHEGIESTLLILQHRLKKDSLHSGIEVIKEYGQLPRIFCYASELNQVFMNLLSNAIDALEEIRNSGEVSDKKPTISIYTEMASSNSVRIRIADNGAGMTEDVKKKIFDPFFTTKPVGSGTGLGLSISYQIVVDKHNGKLSCVSSSGLGTEFIIEMPISQ